MIITAFLFSIALNFNKETVLQSDIFFSSGFVLGILGIIFFIWYFRGKKSARGILRNAPSIITAGIILTGEAITINAAFTLTLVPYVIAVQRLSILFCILTGGIVLQETDMKKRLIFGFVMVGGTILIILTSPLW
jgi:hypothetical protein